jgi:hypothetical protein
VGQLRQPYLRVSHRVCRAFSRPLTQQCQSDRQARRSRRYRRVYPAGARTRESTAPLALWLLVIGGWTMGLQDRERYWRQFPVTQRAREGGASSGRDTTARLFQGRQTPSLACFFVYSLLFFAVRKDVCTRLLNTITTKWFHMFDSGRFLVSAVLSYRPFNYCLQSRRSSQRLSSLRTTLLPGRIN